MLWRDEPMAVGKPSDPSPGALGCCTGLGLIPAGDAEERGAELRVSGCPSCLWASLRTLSITQSPFCSQGHKPVQSPTLGQSLPSASAETIYFDFFMRRSVTLLTPNAQTLTRILWHYHPVGCFRSGLFILFQRISFSDNCLSTWKLSLGMPWDMIQDQ